MSNIKGATSSGEIRYIKEPMTGRFTVISNLSWSGSQTFIGAREISSNFSIAASMPLVTLSLSSMAMTFLALPSPGERYWTWQWSMQELRVTSIDPG
jgi:hypothetical protein